MRLAGAQPVCPVIAERGQHGQLRFFLEPGVADRAGPGGGEVSHGGGALGVARSGDLVGDALDGRALRGPTGLARRGRRGRSELIALGVLGQRQQPAGLLAVREMQDRALDPGGLRQLGAELPGGTGRGR